MILTRCADQLRYLSFDREGLEPPTPRNPYEVMLTNDTCFFPNIPPFQRDVPMR